MQKDPKTQKRAVAIHDISCVGKCSLTVALPVLSAAGVETSVLPTALLSTHTGGFEGYTYLDLTDEMLPIARHWQTLGLKVDAFYTGFLGSESQTDLVCGIIDMLADRDTLIFTDPVMGDNGRLYASYRPTFPEKMKKLCRRSHILTPNLTEACLLTGTEYRGNGYGMEYISDILRKLALFGAGTCVVTGVSLEKGTLGAAYFDAKTGKEGYAFSENVNGMFHGAGDVFASALLGAILNGKTVEDSVRIALDLTVGSIRRTHAAGTDTRFGLDFEHGISDYARAVFGG